MQLIAAEYGLTGWAVIVKIWSEIYSTNGYWILWDKEQSLLFSKANNLENKYVKNVVSSAIQGDIFDMKIFLRFKILTSNGIQKRWINSKRRSKLLICNDLWIYNISLSEDSKNISKRMISIEIPWIENIKMEKALKIAKIDTNTSYCNNNPGYCNNNPGYCNNNENKDFSGKEKKDEKGVNVTKTLVNVTKTPVNVEKVDINDTKYSIGKERKVLSLERQKPLVNVTKTPVNVTQTPVNVTQTSEKNAEIDDIISIFISSLNKRERDRMEKTGDQIEKMKKTLENLINKGYNISDIKSAIQYAILDTFWKNALSSICMLEKKNSSGGLIIDTLLHRVSNSNVCSNKEVSDINDNFDAFK
jgi:hypothetical protein